MLTEIIFVTIYIKEMAESWGGNVYVKTKFNESSGSIFTVEIPIYEKQISSFVRLKIQFLH